MAVMTGETTTHEANFLTRLLAPVGECMSREVAKKVADLRADPDVQARVDELADKCTEGALTAEERAEYEAYVHASRIIGVLQSQARGILYRDDAA
jgi:transglutaminase-like putative cysteine protease